MRTSQLRPFVVTAVLSAAALAASAQMSPPAQGGPGPMAGPQGPHAPMMRMHGTHGGPDATARQAQRAERQARHLAELKTRLQLSPAQEPAWNTFAEAMKPEPPLVADRAALRAEMEKLSTPERIERMQQLRAQAQARMDARLAAIKTFYAQLNPAQQKIFDLESKRWLEHEGRHAHPAEFGPGMKH
ncbi:LTXXQ motif family protein [Tibeticola sediminis]|uniref:LTXXQ motif family protein n=1 Tax=Tibeticola sediminis TaxID=1917811 RepID=A0A3N4UEG1_9BURK|nr:Spy/CpxP family protein refolding chaperone [Tibeticola sediminis]RPE66855.1 LTXXQ motif family protein [Tibeticola sediminis]